MGGEVMEQVSRESVAKAMCLLMEADDAAAGGILGNSREALLSVRCLCQEARELLGGMLTVGDLVQVRRASA